MYAYVVVGKYTGLEFVLSEGTEDEMKALYQRCQSAAPSSMVYREVRKV